MPNMPNFWVPPIISGTGKATDYKRVHLHGQSEWKPIKNFREKGAMAYPGTVQIFGVPPVIWGTDKATDFKFCRNIQRVDPNKSAWQMLGIVAVGVVRESWTFSGHHIGRIARSSLRQHSFLVTNDMHRFKWQLDKSQLLVELTVWWVHPIYSLSQQAGFNSSSSVDMTAFTGSLPVLVSSMSAPCVCWCVCMYMSASVSDRNLGETE